MTPLLITVLKTVMGMRIIILVRGRPRNGCDGRLMGKGDGEKRSEIQGGGQEIAVMVGQW